MTEWRLIDFGLYPASYNMALDEAIAVSVRRGDSPPTLRLYGWERTSVSLGLFQKITDVNRQHCINNSIPIVRRPTGGRAILHGDDLTYSFSARNSGGFSGSLLETYRKLSIAFKAALYSIGLRTDIKIERESGRTLIRSPLCFKSISYGEISFNGEKLIGSAQKRWTDGFMQQGSIPYTVNAEEANKVFNLEYTDYIKDRMAGLKEVIPGLSYDILKAAIKSAFEENFNVSFIRSGISQEEHLLACELETQKYLSTEWNFQR